MRHRKCALGFLLAVIVLLTTACSPYSYHGTLVDPPKAIDDFTAQTSDGSLFRLSNVEADVVVLFFGYTHCPDICPTTLYELREAREALGDQAEDVQFIFVTVDPARDAPERMREYLQNVDGAFVGLYEPDADRLAELAEQFGVYYELVGADESSQDYMVNHTSAVMAVDRSGWRIVWPYGTPGKNIASDLRELLKDQ